MTLKQKEVLLEQINVPEKRSAKRSNRKPPKIRAGTPECIELLLKCLKEYKVTCNCVGLQVKTSISLPRVGVVPHPGSSASM